jgi:hypothetical protein
LFPSVAYAEAGRLSTEFATFVSAAAINPVNLWHVVIRAFDEPICPKDLREKLKEFSELNSGRIDYLARRSDGGPLLAVMHIRHDGKRGGFDPHMHFIWEAPPASVPLIETYLRERYSHVWIDGKPVRDAGKLAFYLARKVFPHSELLGWTNAALLAAWDQTKGVKLVRPSGAFLKPPTGTGSATSAGQASAESNLETVRAPSPESDIFLRSADATLSITQIACVVAILRHQAQQGDGSFFDRSHAPFLDGELIYYVTDFEEQLGAKLFDRDNAWRPTRMGRTVLAKFDGYSSWLMRASPLPMKSVASTASGMTTAARRPSTETRPSEP